MESPAGAVSSCLQALPYVTYTRRLPHSPLTWYNALGVGLVATSSTCCHHSISSRRLVVVSAAGGWLSCQRSNCGDYVVSTKRGADYVMVYHATAGCAG
jgi:hypothetical protein